MSEPDILTSLLPLFPDLAEALAWLDYCLGETEAAMLVVKKLSEDTEDYHQTCEAAAQLINFWQPDQTWEKTLKNRPATILDALVVIFSPVLPLSGLLLGLALWLALAFGNRVEGD